MTEAGWTRATDVTQPGWYWLRRVGSLTVVQVIAVPGYEQRHWIVEGVNLRWSLGNMDGEFLGPISLDSYKQGRVASCEWKYDDMDDYYETACKNAYCLADGTLKDNEHKYCPYCGGLIQLAQQAQEGGVGDGQ